MIFIKLFPLRIKEKHSRFKFKRLVESVVVIIALHLLHAKKAYAQFHGKYLNICFTPVMSHESFCASEAI